MAYQFTTISENDWGNGIDQQSAENAVKPGFVEDLINGDPKAEGYVAKRVGYQGIAGNIPVRVSGIEYTGTDLCFVLDTAVNLSQIKSCPIFVKGRLSTTSGGGDFDVGSDSTKYYTGFTVDDTISLPSSSNTLVITASQHGQGTPHFTPRFYQKGITSNSLFYVNTVSISKTTYDLTIGYNYSPAVGDPSDLTAYIIYANRSTSSYIAPSTTAIPNNSISYPITVSSSTHNQSTSSNLLVELWQDDGSNYILIKPDQVTIDTLGNVTLNVTNKTGSTIQVFPVITDVSRSNTKTSSLNYTNRELEITDLQSDFVGASIYIKNAVTNALTEVIPDSFVINPTTRTLTVSFGFDNKDYADAIVANGESTFVIYYENLTLISNKLCVTAASPAVGTVVDLAPQITLWGLDHTTLYGANPIYPRSGWVTHIDSYKAPAVNTLIAGLGGNIFAVDPPSPAITLYPNIRGQTVSSSEQSIGPAFYGLSDTANRTAGYCKFTGGEENWARVTTVTWISNNVVEYTLSTPNRVDTSNPIDVATDRLTVEGCGWSVNNGTFAISSVSYSAPSLPTSTITVRVTNTNRDSADFNETDSGGLAGVFTSTITLSAPSSFITNDRLISDLFDSGTDLRVVESTGTSLTIGNLIDSYTLPVSFLIIGQREGRVLPLRTFDITPSVSNLVMGDMCSYNDLTRLLRIKKVNADSNRSVALNGDGTTLTVTLLSGSTSSLNVGQRILLIQNEELNGEHEIQEIIDNTQFTVENSTVITAGTAVLVGNNVELDETLTLTDSINNEVSFSVPYRWIPVEAPTNTGTSLPQTYVSHFPAGGYGEQNILRSTMSSSNLYLTNGSDQVMKFDGDNVYRAGLPRWQPQAFITVDEDPSNLFVPGKIEIDNPPINCTARDIHKFTIAYSDRGRFSADDKIYDTADHQIYTVKTITDDGGTSPTNAYIEVKETISHQGSGTHALTNAFYYRYYFRLNAVDANGNTIASAVTGYFDNIVLIEHSSQIRIRLIGFPAWDNYDYDKLEVQAYRTKLDQSAPFYRVAAVQLDYSANTGYVDIVDTLSDSSLTDKELDRVSTVSEGAELGTQWSGPLRSKYITSAANKLILGNIETDPQLDITILAPGNAGALTKEDFQESTNPGKRFLFRKDNTDVGTTTDNLNRLAYEFRSTGEMTVTGVSNSSGTSSFTVTTSTPHGLTQNDWVYLTNKITETDWTYTSVSVSTGDEWVRNSSVTHGYVTGQRVVYYSASPIGGLQNANLYYVIVVDPNTLQFANTLADALAGNKINLTSAGGSTGNLEPHTQIRLQYAGWWQVASVGAGPSPTTFTINHTHSNPDGSVYTPAPGSWEINIAVKATDPRDVPVWIGVDGSMEATASKNPTAIENMAVDRLSRAINASQRLCRTVGFEPWLIANSGGDYGRGQIIINQPKSIGSITEVLLPSFSEFIVFVNNIQRTSSSSVSTYSIKYPSRIIASYTNYPELFDNTTAINPDRSKSVIDVNSADGQEITGVISFFGESAFGAALRSGVVVVFKTHSIYVIDLAEKAAGRNPVQKVESQGLGCTAPYSIANTRDGIIFANESGIYKLTRQLAVEYVGRKAERVWRNRVTSDALQLAFGHHYGTGSQYKISVPLDGGTAPGDLLVYSHVREYQGGIGAWGRYSHSPAIGWCNLQANAYFASIDGRVYSIRRAGDNTDYRDDDQPIPFELTLRAMDFGDGGIRKIISHIITKFRVLGDSSGTVLSTAADLTNNFVNADTFRIDSPTDNSTGLSDPNSIKVQTIRFSIDNRKLVFLQVRFSNSTIDEPVEIAEVSVRVSGMTDKGITSAART